ncbi:SpoIIE family protein phosphatase [Streptomyces sp. B21-105]|uniref:SpoIIE family protein phosphatase n=1 Tax=Streptomyces sp. B21-105 TaxID=3039417 RepID=UPI002FEFB616|nr:SpoIIE family protein phosphatase [Streptomyces canus]
MAEFAKMRGGLRATQRHGAQPPDIAMMSVVALTVPLVLLELAISDSTVRLRLLIGDVRGKGLPAVAAAFAALGAFRETARSERTRTAVAGALEAAVERHNAFAAQSGEPERLVTALLLGVDNSAETQALNCGHFPLYLMTRASSPSHSRPNQACRSVRPNSPRNQGPSNGSLSRTARHSRSAAAASPRHVTPPASSIPSKRRLRGRADVSPWKVAHKLTADLRRYTDGEQRDDITALVVLKVN